MSTSLHTVFKQQMVDKLPPPPQITGLHEEQTDSHSTTAKK